MIASQVMTADDIFMPPMTCQCCGATEELRSCRIMGASCVCSDCIHVWYEYGLTDSDAIGAKVKALRAKGQKP